MRFGLLIALVGAASSLACSSSDEGPTAQPDAGVQTGGTGGESGTDGGTGGMGGTGGAGASGGEAGTAASAGTGGMAGEAGHAGTSGTGGAAGGAGAAGQGGSGGGFGTCLHGTQSADLGDPCGCQADCADSNPLCLPQGDERYCTTECKTIDACPDGFECAARLLDLGMPSYCVQCAATPGVAEIGNACACDSDCGSYGTRPLSCLDRTCTLSPCMPVGPNSCPDGYACETGNGSSRCVQCVQPSPAPAGSSCGCKDDCQSGLVCADGACAVSCDTDDACPPGQECREGIDGQGACTPVSTTCTGTQDGSPGSPCTCNADCSDEAPVCLTESVAGFDTGFCVTRPCSTSESCAPGVGGAYRCCTIPLVLSATCIPAAMASQIDAMAVCGP
jgi:hypothetical protein